MATIYIDTKKIIENITMLHKFLSSHNKQWSLVLKMLSGNEEILKRILATEIIDKLYCVADSRLYNLQIIKKLRPDIKTMYIQPPSIRSASKIVQYANISLNTSLPTIKALNEQARIRNIKHGVIVMIELGELREGILPEKIIDFYDQLFRLEHIDIVGMGTNLGCMYGIEPTREKLFKFSLYAEKVANFFGKKLPLVSGGSSITLPLLQKNLLPEAVNHFRIGEAAFLGVEALRGKRFQKLHTDAFSFQAVITELEKKSNQPEGTICDGNVGEGKIAEKKGKHYRAILDFGAIDVDAKKHISPKESGIRFIGTTSDVSVFEIDPDKNLQVGSSISFRLKYMGAVRLMNSRFIRKEIL